MKRKHLKVIVAVAITAIAISSCSKFSPLVNNTPVTGIGISPTSVTLQKGETQQLTATVQPANATNQNVNWLSTDSQVATVSTSGLVTAVADGSASIVATTADGGDTATCKVTVTSGGGGPATYSISGTITLNSSGLSGVKVSAGSAWALTDSNGSYTISGLTDNTYTLAPSLSGYAFTPASVSVTINGSNATARNFTAKKVTSGTYSISGTITLNGAGLSGVAVSAGSGSPSATTNSTGNYIISGLANGAYTVTPSLSGSSFSPANQAVTVNGANVSGVNFTAGAHAAIGLSPTTLRFAAKTGGQNPPAQSVTVSDSGGGTLSNLSDSISYTQGSGWLTASLSSTVAPSTLTVQPSIGSLGSGTYSATIEVASSIASNSPQGIKVTLQVTQTTYLLTVQSGGNGTTNPSGQLTVAAGGSTNISASPSTGYVFSDWSVVNGTGVTFGSKNSTNTTVTLAGGNATVRANFTPIQYTLGLRSGGNGSVYPSGSITVDYGASTSISASPSSCYQFKDWTVASGGGVSFANSTSSNTTVALTNGSATVQANFIPIQYTLTVQSGGNGSVTPSGSYTVNCGSSTTISASASTNYHFVNWTTVSGSGVSYANANNSGTSVDLTNGSATVQANFAIDTGTISVTAEDQFQNPQSGAVVVVYNSAGTAVDQPTTNSNGVTSPITLPVGNYWFEIYYNGEFWDTTYPTTMYIGNNSANYLTTIREEPFLDYATLTYPVLGIGGSYKITVANTTQSSLSVYLDFEVSATEGGTPIYGPTASSAQTIASGSTATFKFSYGPKTGDWYRVLDVMTYVHGKYTETDVGPWVQDQ